MASPKTFNSRSTYRFLTSDLPHYNNSAISSNDAVFELDESDVWTSPATAARSDSPEMKPPPASSRSARRMRGGEIGGAARSVPVNIPDWSKILREEYAENRRREMVEDEEEDDVDDYGGGGRVPPHEYLARRLSRTQIASFSVHEGVGRTLKGRDLSRVRNAIWEKTGFQD